MIKKIEFRSESFYHILTFYSYFKLESFTFDAEDRFPDDKYLLKCLKDHNLNIQSFMA